ncbi:hypothetical protein AB3329_10475 [Streptococcus sp. H31]|uniref:hypothetical protein n=1 Tax=Streptococcus huangxiaojuni TaxID=3237239 RepID=UPI0034A43CE0
MDARDKLIDTIQTKINKQQVVLEDMEDQHQRDKKAQDKQYNDLEERFQLLRQMFERVYETASYDLRQSDQENGEAFSSLTDTINIYLQTNENRFMNKRSQLDEKTEKQETLYNKQHRQAEDKLDELYTRRLSASHATEEELEKKIKEEAASEQ